MAETGVLCGPAKLSFLYAWSNGPDRRAGVRDNINQGTVQDPMNDVSYNVTDTTAAYATGGLFPRWQPQSVSNTSVFKPYSFLMVYDYGTGAYINADTGKGFMEDASCFGGRLDYAVAANLNVYASGFWADRVGNGYGWGFLRPSQDAQGAFPGGVPPQTGVTNTVFGQVYQQYKGNPNLSVNGAAINYANIAPNIPDNNLGWEVDAGGDWKLLEGLTLSLTGAYWQPGKWFSYACVDKGNPAWNGDLKSGTLGTANNWGTHPGKRIDPIVALEIRVIGEF
jgi:hypothetical protein